MPLCATSASLLSSHVQDLVQDPAGGRHVLGPNRQVVFPGRRDVQMPCKVLDDLICSVVSATSDSSGPVGRTIGKWA